MAQVFGGKPRLLRENVRITRPPLARGYSSYGEMKMKSKRKIERCDHVDKAIFDLIQNINPTKEKIEWDIQAISEIREILRDFYVNVWKVCADDKFYP